MNRTFAKLAVLSVAVTAAAVITIARPAAAPQKRAIALPGEAADLPFSNGLVVGNTLYISGQQGHVNGKLVPGGIGPETQATLETIKKIVTDAGFQMTDVATVTVYITDMGDFKEMTRVYKTFFPQPRPARATVQVAGLVGGARVEISAIAQKAH